MNVRVNNPRYIANAKARGGKRTIEQREADKKFSADLFVKGYAYRAIADRLNEHNHEQGLEYTVTYKTVFLDIQRYWRSGRKSGSRT